MIEGNEPPIRTTTSTGNAGSKRKFRLANKAVPPPRTATVRRLEQLLDAKPKKRKKLVPKRVIEPMVAPSLIVAQPPRPKDALAFRGGLASVPNFRKASMPPRKKTMVQDCDSKTSNVRSQITDRIPRLRASDLATIHHLSSQQKRDATRLVKELQSTQDQPKKSPSLSPKIVECPLIHPTTESKSINESSTFCSIKHMEPDFQKTIPTKLDAKPDPQPREATTAHLQIGLHLGKVRKEASRSAGWKSDFQRTLMDNTTNNHDNRDILHLPPSSSKDIELATFPTVKEDIHNPPVILQTKPSTASRTTLASQNITQTSASTSTSSSTDCRRKATRTVNDNFVRLNLRNSAGACRGARNKKLRRKSRHHDNDYSNKNKESYASDEDMEATKFSTKSGTMREQSYVCRMTGLDPLDDYLDGVFASTIQSRKVKQNNASNQTSSTHDEAAIPLCACHQRPCKLVVVKKNTKGNKGRKFYACSMPRGEQCDHFQWAEDTIEAARQTVVDNAHHSSFIARQVAAHVDRFRNLTIPELQQEAARRRLNKHGKKSQLLLRLALWTRDEIVKAVPYPDDEKEDAEVAEIPCRPRKDAMSKEDSQESESDEEASSSSEASEEELELFHRTSQEDEESIVEELDQQKIGNDLMTHETMSSLTLLSSLTSIFGHSQFREGQEWAIERCLAGNKSLLVAPTGFGKSLCYALPAALMDGVCVVVSPLISLIQASFDYHGRSAILWHSNFTSLTLAGSIEVLAATYPGSNTLWFCLCFGHSLHP